MHEMSICLSLLESVQRVADEHAAPGVARICLKIGPLSGVEADLLRNAYPLAAAGTIAADAELVIETDPILVRCNQCGAESAAQPNRLSCSECGDNRTTVIQGTEMVLQSVELTVEAPVSPIH